MLRPVSDTRQKLIDTATALIWQASYGAVGVDDICRAADVKKGSLYHYFPSKAELALAAMDEHFGQKRAQLDEIFARSVPPLVRFEKLADFILAQQEDVQARYGRVCGCPFAALGSEIAGREELIRNRTEEIFAAHRTYCEGALRDAVAAGILPLKTDVAAIAADICSFVLGLMTMARIENNLDGLRRELKEGMLRIIGAGQKKKAA